MAVCLMIKMSASAVSLPNMVIDVAARQAFLPQFAEPTSVSVSSVTATGATVTFVLPSSDRAATSESVIVYAGSGRAEDEFDLHHGEGSNASADSDSDADRDPDGDAHCHADRDADRDAHCHAD